MFDDCPSLKDITPIKNWNVSNGTGFNGMFGDCPLLNDITPLKNWNLDENTFRSMLDSIDE